jgi:hypothetical protein
MARRKGQNKKKKKEKKKRKKRHRHLAVKFGTTPKNFSPSLFTTFSLGLSLTKYYTSIHPGK